MKKALICGISGQDGSYLAQLLLRRGYEVWGTSRDAELSDFKNLRELRIFEDVNLLSMAANDFRSVMQVISRTEFQEVYHLAGQSSVGLSFEQPIETLESIASATLNLLEAIRYTALPTRFYNASSSECFGETGAQPADETTPFRPKSPYAIAKAAAHWTVANYRDAYGVWACSGILFNHESPLRPERYVTKKIASFVARTAKGSRNKLNLGDLTIIRDWGWAPEYVEAMWRMVQQDKPQDYLIATGESHSLEEFTRVAFEYIGKDWQDYVAHDESLRRPTDLLVSRGNPTKARTELGWTATVQLQNVVTHMINAELERISA